MPLVIAYFVANLALIILGRALGLSENIIIMGLVGMTGFVTLLAMEDRR